MVLLRSPAPTSLCVSITWCHVHACACVCLVLSKSSSGTAIDPLCGIQLMILCNPVIK